MKSQETCAVKGPRHHLSGPGVHLRSLAEGGKTSTPLGTIFYQLACVFAEYERTLISGRRQPELEAARAAG